MKGVVAVIGLLASAMLLAGVGIGAEKTVQEKNIVDTAIADGNFTTLVKAIQSTGLLETLKGPGSFTVFAPDDKAFAKIQKADLNALLANKTALTKVLSYHVIPAKVMSGDLKDGMNLTTVQGENLTIKIDKAGVMVGNAKIIKTDIETSNGVIHVIDVVQMPK